jgi:hypothetical protein
MPTRAWTRPLWNLGGTVCLALGALGVPLPVLPTTPFLLLAAACFLRGSPRMHAWMMTNRYFGTYLAEYRAGHGIPMRTKVSAIALLWAGIGASAAFFVTSALGRGVLLTVAVAVTAHIVLIRPRRQGPPAAGSPGGPAVRLVEAVEEDGPLIERWLRREHVRRWWGDPDETLHEIAARGDKLRQAIIEADGTSVGLVLWGHPPRAELDAAGLLDVPETVVDIDIMIGEPDALGRGIGTEALRLVAVTALADPAVPHLIAAASAGNDASLRAFAKAGFRVNRVFDDPESGPCLLLRRDRLVQ